MIDVEVPVYAKVTEALLAAFPDIGLSSEHVRAPPSFPHVSIVELDNTVYRRSQDENTENHASLLFEWNAYSNLKTGKKAQCRAIAAVLDSAFAALNFTRTMQNPIPNAESATIYRIVGRHSAVVGKDGLIYRK